MRGSVQTAVCVAEDAPRQGGGSGGRYRGNDRELHRGDGGWRLSSALMQPKYAYARLGVTYNGSAANASPPRRGARAAAGGRARLADTTYE